MKFRLSPLIAIAGLLLPGVAIAQTSPSEQRGSTFVIANCGGCHATDKVSASTLPIAPPFRDLHLKYPIENLREALVEGIVTGHPTMPEFRLDTGQASDVIAYLETLGG
jgi:cytochrome c